MSQSGSRWVMVLKLNDRLRRFLEIWHQMYLWEQDVFLMMMRMTLHKRALLPAMTYQSLAMGLIMLIMPGQILLWSLVFVVSMVYALMVAAFLRRL